MYKIPSVGRPEQFQVTSARDAKNLVSVIWQGWIYLAACWSAILFPAWALWQLSLFPEAAIWLAITTAACRHELQATRRKHPLSDHDKTVSSSSSGNHTVVSTKHYDLYVRPPRHA